jgi:hypothetical protein
MFMSDEVCQRPHRRRGIGAPRFSCGRDGRLATPRYQQQSRCAEHCLLTVLALKDPNECGAVVALIS